MNELEREILTLKRRAQQHKEAVVTVVAIALLVALAPVLIALWKWVLS